MAIVTTQAVGVWAPRRQLYEKTRPAGGDHDLWNLFLCFVRRRSQCFLVVWYSSSVCSTHLASDLPMKTSKPDFRDRSVGHLNAPTPDRYLLSHVESLWMTETVDFCPPTSSRASFRECQGSGELQSSKWTPAPIPAPSLLLQHFPAQLRAALLTGCILFFVRYDVRMP